MVTGTQKVHEISADIAEYFKEEKKSSDDIRKITEELRNRYLGEYDLGDPLAPTNVATRKYQIWVSLFPGGNFLAKLSY